MGTFSQDMRNTALELITEFGNPCTLTKVSTPVYDPLTGESIGTNEVFNTVSAPYNIMSKLFGDNGENTNLAGLGSSSVTIPWFGEDIDSTWLYDGNNIESVSPTKSQGDIIIYDITIGEG